MAGCQLELLPNGVGSSADGDTQRSDPGSVSFWVGGVPQPKGSTRSFRIPKSNRIITTSDNPNLLPWEATVRSTAEAVWTEPPSKGAFRVDVAFFFVRPQSVSPKRRPHHIVKPDLDKLWRGVLDGMEGVVYLNDSQVTKGEPSKDYGPRPGARITIRRIT